MLNDVERRALGLVGRRIVIEYRDGSSGTGLLTEVFDGGLFFRSDQHGVLASSWFTEIADVRIAS